MGDGIRVGEELQTSGYQEDSEPSPSGVQDAWGFWVTAFQGPAESSVSLGSSSLQP